MSSSGSVQLPYHFFSTGFVIFALVSRSFILGTFWYFFFFFFFFFLMLVA
jgi:hypothetical protein